MRLHAVASVSLTGAPAAASARFASADGSLAEVEDRRRQHCIRAALGHRFRHVPHIAGAARCHDRHAHHIAHRAQKFDVIAVLGAVAVHRRQQDFARAQARPRASQTAWRPCPRFCGRHACRRPTAILAAHIQRHHHGLRAHLPRARRQDLRLQHCRSVDRHLVGACLQHRHHIVRRAHPAAHRQRHETGIRRPLDHVDHGAAALDRGCYVEKAQLVRALRVVGPGQRNGISCVPQIDEVDALHGAPVLHVETRNDADLQHAVLSPERGGKASAEGQGRPQRSAHSRQRLFRVDVSIIKGPAENRAGDGPAGSRLQGDEVRDTLYAA